MARLDPDGAAPPDDDAQGDEVHLLRRRDGSLALAGRITDRVDAEMLLEVFDALATPGRPAGRARPAPTPRRGTQGPGRPGPGPHRPGHRRDPPAPPRTQPDREPGREPEREAGTDPDAQGARDGASAGEGEPAGAWIPAPRRPEPSEVGPRQPARPVRRAWLTITMDHRWLARPVGHGVLDSDTPVDPGTVRRWACDAGIIPVVLGGRSEPLDVGRLSYTVPEAIRRALHSRLGDRCRQLRRGGGHPGQRMVRGGRVPRRDRVYVADIMTPRMSVIDTTTRTVAATIAFAADPGAAFGSRVYITQPSANRVLVVDAATNQVAATIPLATDPADVAVTPDGRHVFVENACADLVTVIETATNTVVAQIPGLAQPVGVAVSAREVYVTHYQEAGVSVLHI